MVHEHLKERGLFGLPPAGANASDYYHQMTLMAGHPTPYGDLLVQTGGATGTPHLHDYLNPVDGECWAGRERGGAGAAGAPGAEHVLAAPLGVRSPTGLGLPQPLPALLSAEASLRQHARTQRVFRREQNTRLCLRGPDSP